MKFKMHLLILYYFLLFCLIIGFTSQSAFSQGRFVFKPSVEAGWRMDSNFHKAQTNEKEVYTYNFKPGFSSEYTTGKSAVGLDYFANVIRYDDRDTVPAGQQKASDSNYLGHNLLLRAQTQATDRMLLDLENLLLRSSDPASADATSNAIDRYKYTLNRFSPRLLYQFGDKYGLELKYTNLIMNYSDDAPGQGEDSTENRGGFALYYYLNSRTAFDLNYQIWNRDYNKLTSDYDSQQVMVNVKHRLNRFTVSAGAGYQNRNFDNSAESNIDSFVWSVALEGQLPKSTMKLSLTRNLNDLGTGNNYITTTRLDAKITYLVMDKINCVLGGWYQNSDYDTSTREDDRWLLSLGADYPINDCFSVGLETGKEKRNSNFAGRDLDNDYFMFNITYRPILGAK